MFILQANPDRLDSPPVFLFHGHSDSLPGVNQTPGGKVDHSPSSNNGVKNECSYISAPPVCIHGTDRKHATNMAVSAYNNMKFRNDLCASPNIVPGDKIEKNEMGGACGAYRREDRCI